jgi:hypothetical protein
MEDKKENSLIYKIHNIFPFKNFYGSNSTLLGLIFSGIISKNSIPENNTYDTTTEKVNTYKINPDNTLTYPDGHNEPIISAEVCGNDIPFCFDIMYDSEIRKYSGQKQFGKTKRALEFYKKTVTSDNSEVLTTLVVPAGTDIFFSSPSVSNKCRKRAAKAIVKEQTLIESGKIVTESMAMCNKTFKYNTNNLVTPSGPFDNFWEWQYDGYPDGGQGIHVFSTKEKARNFDYD